MFKLQIFVLIINFLFILAICEAIRRRKLDEKYALLWLVSALVIFIFTLFPDLLFKISDKLGVYYLSTLFILCFVFLMAITFSYAIFITRLTQRNKTLSQEVAILKSKVERLQRRIYGAKKQDNKQF